MSEILYGFVGVSFLVGLVRIAKVVWRLIERGRIYLHDHFRLFRSKSGNRRLPNDKGRKNKAKAEGEKYTGY